MSIIYQLIYLFDYHIVSNNCFTNVVLPLAVFPTIPRVNPLFNLNDIFSNTLFSSYEKLKSLNSIL